MVGIEINCDESSNVETARDQATVFQGVNKMTKGRPKRPRTTSRRRSKRLSDDPESETPVEEDATATEASSRPSRSRSGSLDEPGETAKSPEATYPTSLSNNPPHYRHLHPGEAEEGDIFRVKREKNDVMHGRTVVIIKVKGRLLTVCSITRDIPEDAEPRFKHYNAEVKVFRKDETPRSNDKKDPEAGSPKLGKTSANLDPVEVEMEGEWSMHRNCWLNLRRPFDMSFEKNSYYNVSFCGKLEAKSCRYARDSYLKFVKDDA